MSLLLVKDNVNSKLRELECDASGNLKVDKVDVSALATESTASSIDAKITACDTSSISGVVNKISIYGSTSNFSDELEIQISHDNTNWFELTEKYVSVDYASGHFGLTIDNAFKYIRMKKVGTGSAMMSDDLWAICSGRK